ncbi:MULTISPECIES: hypothetical protein [unclassified Sphingomonas]|jgi:hypothetical protein|nr:MULTISPECIES: hypothetical protein [unclassified Sphingomonas]
MKNTALPHGQGPSVIHHAPPLAGIIIGAAISLILWAIIAALVFAVA